MDNKRERHNEISRLCERRRREWKKVSKMFLEILLEDKSYKVYKTDEEKQKIMLKCVKNTIVMLELIRKIIISGKVFLTTLGKYYFNHIL